MRRHVLMPAIRVAMLAALAAALVTISPAPPAGAAPGHLASLPNMFWMFGANIPSGVRGRGTRCN